MKTIKAGGAGRSRVTLAQGQLLVIMWRERPNVLMTDFNPLPLVCQNIPVRLNNVCLNRPTQSTNKPGQGQNGV